MTYLELYRYERIIQSKRARTSNRLLLMKKIMFYIAGAMDQWWHYKKDLSSAFEKANSQWKYIFESRHIRTKNTFKGPRKNSPKNSNIYYFSNIFFLCRRENAIGDRSSEEHLKNPKTTPDAYLGLGLSIFVNNSSVHLVTQSL
jgi:hypothetical protein